MSNDGDFPNNGEGNSDGGSNDGFNGGDDNAPLKSGWKSRIRGALGSAKDKLSKKAKEENSPEHHADLSLASTGEAYQEPTGTSPLIEDSPSPSLRRGERLKHFISSHVNGDHWQLREKLVRFLPQDLAKNFPTTFEPMALAEWAGEAFQRQGAAVYGKLLTILLCAWFLADLTALLVENYIPEPPVTKMAKRFDRPKNTKSLEFYNVIFSRNLFNSSGKIPGEENQAPVDTGGAPIRTNLPFNLVGTMILTDELRSIGTIEDKSASITYPVRIQDEIPGKAKIIKVEPYRVIFLNTSSGRREFIDMPEDTTTAPKISARTGKTGAAGPTIEKLSETQFNISRVEVEKTLSDLNNVLTQARCVPNFENGTPSGYKCFQIVPGSIYDKLGMQNGDVLTGINGENINDPGKAFEMLSQLKTANHVDLSLKRNGATKNYSYDIR